MNYSEPNHIGIIACPAGESFAAPVIRRLTALYKRRFDKRATVLAKRYALSKDIVTRQINFNNDIQGANTNWQGDPNICRAPKFRLDTRFTCFANGELKAEIIGSVRGKDLYIIQDIENHHPVTFSGGVVREMSVNDNIFNLMVTVDAAMQAGASRITLVIPAYPYSRQHKKKGREGLTAARFGQIMEYMGVARIITLDIHSREIENCFNKTRLENLHASYQIIRQLARIVDVTKNDLVVVSPDTGAVDRNKFYASALNKPLALLYKERDYSKVSKDANDSNITDMKLLGNVKGKIVFMADDMLGTGGTLLKAMKFLKDQGAEKVICAISLPFFSGNAVDAFDKAYNEGLFYRIIGTNAVYHDELVKKQWFISTDITDLFAHIISLLHHDKSLSQLLDNRAVIDRMLKSNDRFIDPSEPKTEAPLDLSEKSSD